MLYSCTHQSAIFIWIKHKSEYIPLYSTASFHATIINNWNNDELLSVYPIIRNKTEILSRQCNNSNNHNRWRPKTILCRDGKMRHFLLSLSLSSLFSLFFLVTVVFRTIHNSDRRHLTKIVKGIFYWDLLLPYSRVRLVRKLIKQNEETQDLDKRLIISVFTWIH